MWTLSMVPTLRLWAQTDNIIVRSMFAISRVDRRYAALFTFSPHDRITRNSYVLRGTGPVDVLSPLFSS